MSRINTNVSALVAQHRLAHTQSQMKSSLERLSTGLAITRAGDNPAGLIASERMRSEIAGVNQAISNAERASNVLATAEGSLQEVNTLLTSIKSLVVEAANTGAFSDAEIEANQLQIDSAIESITRIANNTSFAGLKLLNGSMDYVTSGVADTSIEDVRVYGANFGNAESLPVEVEVVNSAETGQLFISGNTAGAPGALLSSVTFEVRGPDGVEVFSFTSGTALSAVAFAVNQVSDATGVSASLVSGTDPTSGLVLSSQEFGSDAFVSVRKLGENDNFNTFDGQGGNEKNRDAGEDVLALVNGNVALGDGREISLRSAALNVQMTLTETQATTLGATNFNITGGGATFQIGPTVDSSQQVGFGIQSMTASSLGTKAMGFLSSVMSGGENSLVNGRADKASKIVDKAVDQVSVLRGRLGAFERNTLDTTVRSQQVSVENLSAAESNIRDTDFAEETAKLTRAQVLTQTGTQVLSLANNSSQSVLSLLQG